MPVRTVLTIGNFDGVHLGHRALIGRARAIADGASEPGRVVAITFHPHPVTVLAPERARAPLSTFAQRSIWMRDAGADEIVRLEPSPGLLGLSPEQFVDRMITDHHPAAFVEGSDFHFGKGRAGSVETLRAIGRERGFDVEVIEPVTVALTDQTVVTASSSITRWLLGNGRVRDAECVLGRPYELAGTVIRGDQRGRDLGFPTANLRIDCLPPATASTPRTPSSPADASSRRRSTSARAPPSTAPTAPSRPTSSAGRAPRPAAWPSTAGP